MFFDRQSETRPLDQQLEMDRESYTRQISYLFENSGFYQDKLRSAGFKSAEELGGLDDIANIPFTEKDEIRASQADYPPFGNHLAAEPQRLMRGR